MEQEVNQKSHDSAICNIIVLLTREHHTLLRHNESIRRERENHLRKGRSSQKKTTKHLTKQKHKSNKRETEPPPAPAPPPAPLLQPPLIRLPKRRGAGTIGKITAIYTAVLANIMGRNNYVEILITLLRFRNEWMQLFLLIPAKEENLRDAFWRCGMGAQHIFSF